MNEKNHDSLRKQKAIEQVVSKKTLFRINSVSGNLGGYVDTSKTIEQSFSWIYIEMEKEFNERPFFFDDDVTTNVWLSRDVAYNFHMDGLSITRFMPDPNPIKSGFMEFIRFLKNVNIKIFDEYFERTCKNQVMYIQIVKNNRGFIDEEQERYCETPFEKVLIKTATYENPLFERAVFFDRALLSDYIENKIRNASGVKNDQ